MFEDITKISQMAKKAALNDPNVINATLGVLLDDNGDICYSKVFDEVSLTLTPNEKFPYENVLGPEVLRDNILKFLHQEKFLQKPNVTMISAGGTGALSNIVSVFSENGGLVVSDLCWNNYYEIAKTFKVDVYDFNTFDGENYNLKAFENAIDKAIIEKDNIIIILNTPSHNPTGYDLTNEELEQIVEMINKKVVSNKKITLVLDIAYYNFGLNQNLDPFLKISEDINLAIVYSFSKSFGIYGFRLGTLTLISKDAKELEHVFNAHSRTKWSNPNKLGCSVLTKILTNDEYCKIIYDEIEHHKQLLENKARILKTSLEENNIKTYPYMSGFFLSIPVDNPEEVALELSKKGIYLTTVVGGLRIAVSGVPSNRVDELAKRIAEVIKED